MTEEPPAPDPEELGALAEKYRALAALRRRRDGGGEPARREELRALSERHPGALRELDTLGAAEIDRRATTAAAAAAGGPREPWMAWVATFHRLMRAALLIKRESATAGKDATQAILDELAARARALAGLPIEAALAATLARPPEGRLAPLVLGEVARRFGVPPHTLSEALFPSRSTATRLP